MGKHWYVNSLLQRTSEILVAIQGPIINTDTRKTVAKTCFFNNVPYVVLSQSFGKHNNNNNKTAHPAIVPLSTTATTTTTTTTVTNKDKSTATTINRRRCGEDCHCGTSPRWIVSAKATSIVKQEDHCRTRTRAINEKQSYGTEDHCRSLNF
jgi:hypothetical protein